MNLPNKLTMARVIMIPLFLFFFYGTGIRGNYLWAFAVFAAAALTDTLDGRIARKRGLVTEFGALMDPLADKLLVMAAMVAFAGIGVIHGGLVIVILAREFLVTSIRLVAAGKGKIIAADIWGKLKTVFQMIWLDAGLLFYGLKGAANPAARELGVWAGMIFTSLGWAVLILTLASGINYMAKNRELFADA